MQGTTAILRVTSTAEALDLAPEPIVVYRSVNRDGQTFALDPLSHDRARELLGDAAHFHPRVFIAHETKADYESVRDDLVPVIVQLLTGVRPERQHELGEVLLLDPGTDMPVRRR